MGDPKKHRKKYKTPSHPWQKDRIEEEEALFQEYGLKNKKELWKMKSLLSAFAHQAKKLIASTTPQTQLEKKQLLNRLLSLGLLSATAPLEDALALDIKKILERRLQTLVFKKTLAKTSKQARQFIIHGHISIGDKKITVPSYLVPKTEEDQILFIPTSSLASLEHPERVVEKPKEEKLAKKKSQNSKNSVDLGTSSKVLGKLETPSESPTKEEKPKRKPKKEVKKEKKDTKKEK